MGAIVSTLISLAVEDLPKLVTLIRSLQSQPNLTPAQAKAYQDSADAILDSIIAWSKTPD